MTFMCWLIEFDYETQGCDHMVWKLVEVSGQNNKRIPGLREYFFQRIFKCFLNGIS